MVFSLTTRARTGWRCCLQIWLFGPLVIIGQACNATLPTLRRLAVVRPQAGRCPQGIHAPAPIENYLMDPSLWQLARACRPITPYYGKKEGVPRQLFASGWVAEVVVTATWLPRGTPSPAPGGKQQGRMRVGAVPAQISVLERWVSISLSSSRRIRLVT